MKTVTFNIPKGGTGKTTSVSILSMYLAMKGYKVLMVDLDPQSNLSLPYYSEIDTPSSYKMMKGDADPKECIYKISDNLHLIGGDVDLLKASFEIQGYDVLKKCLDKVKKNYDVCIIDTQPTLNILNFNALACSDGVIIPITPDKFALNGIRQVKQIYDNIKAEYNKKLNLYGILITRCDTTLASEVMIEQAQDIAEYMGTFVYDAKIRNAVAIRKSQDIDANLLDIYPREKVTQDYKAFCEEFENKYIKGGK